MIDVGQLAAAVGTLKAAGEIGKGLLSLHTMTEVQAKAIELNQAIIEAQHQVFAANAAQTTLVNRVRELEGEIAAMKNWDGEQKRYKLIAPFPGCMVFALQKAMSDGEPAHYLCAACFKKGKPSILQGREGRPLGKDKGYARACYACPDCDSEASTGYNNAPAPQYFEDIRPEA
jgi:hypothetical protein